MNTVVICDERKLKTFVSVMLLLKHSSEVLYVRMEEDRWYMQGIDAAHACVYECCLESGWFEVYDVKFPTKLAVKSDIFIPCIVQCSKNEEYTFTLQHTIDSDEIIIKSTKTSITTKGPNDQFTIPLCEVDYEELTIPPDLNYDVIFELETKMLHNKLNGLSNYGDDLSLICNDNIHFKAFNNTQGSMTSTFTLNDVLSYESSDDPILDMFYSLKIINKLCISSNVAPIIKISASNGQPLKLEYNIGNGSLIFHISPKDPEFN